MSRLRRCPNPSDKLRVFPPQAHVRGLPVPRHKGGAASPHPQRTRPDKRCRDPCLTNRKFLVPYSVDDTDRELLASRPRCGQSSAYR